jgi:hypothetical protein
LVETASTANATSYASASYAPTASRGLIAFVHASATLAADATFVGNGVTWTLEERRTRSTTSSIYVFSALSGGSPSSGTGTFDCTSDAASGAMIQVVEINGCDLTDHVTQVGGGTFTVGAPVGTFSGATASDCAILGHLGSDTNPAAVTVPTSYSELMNSGYNTPATGAQMVYHASPGSVSTVTWGGTSASGGSVQVVEIRAVSVPPSDTNLLVVNTSGI